MMTDNNEEFLDKDGFPTDEALEMIEKWEYTDKKGCFEFIKSLWCWEEYFDEKEDEDEIFKHPIIRYHISTGDWSGNGSLIGPL